MERSANPDARRDVEGAVELFKAMASPIRLEVVVELATGPRCVHELSAALRASGRDVSQPLLSQHLKVLRDVGLVSATRRTTEVAYELIDSHVAQLVSDAMRHSREILGSDRARTR